VTFIPPWFEAASEEIGVREVPENRGPAIRRYIQAAGCGSEGDPWCAIFANAMLESVGIHGTRSAAARSFERHNNFRKLDRPALGCIVTFWRNSRNSGLGHVGFYNGEYRGLISTLGGNEGDMVRIENYNSSSPRFGLSGFYWPIRDRNGNQVPAPGIWGPVAPHLSSSGGSGKVV
jgi:uncharacterized protein (TIGR02594 family)